MSRGLADLFLEALAVLEAHGGGLLHEDDAIRMLEHLLFEMESLDPADKAALRAEALRKAGEETDPERRQFFADAPRVFRLDE